MNKNIKINQKQEIIYSNKQQIQIEKQSVNQKLSISQLKSTPIKIGFNFFIQQEMIREAPNRYDKLNFSFDDIQNQDNSNLNTPFISGKVNIQPLFVKQVQTTRESQTIVNQQKSSQILVSSSSSNSQSKSSSRSSSLSSIGNAQQKHEDDTEGDHLQNKNKYGQKNKNKYQKLKFVRNSSPTHNPNSIKETLANHQTLFHSKDQYFIQPNGQNFRKRRLLSFQGEETSEFRDLVKFLDKVKKNNELPAHKMIRKNSCCCQNCGQKSSKQLHLDKLIPQFKPAAIIKNMYRKTFQKTIKNISKINRFFRSKLQIRTDNNNNIKIREKKASPTKFLSQSSYKISPLLMEKKQNFLNVQSQQEISALKLQPLQLQANKAISLQVQPSISQNNTNHTSNDRQFKERGKFKARSSLLVYSNSEHFQQIIAQLKQNPSTFKRSAFNQDQQRAHTVIGSSPQHQTESISEQNIKSNNNIQSTSKQSINSRLTSPLILQKQTSIGKNQKSTQYPKKQQVKSLTFLKLKQSTQNNIVVEDKVIDQFRKETQLGNINNDFVKSVGNILFRQSQTNIPTFSELGIEKQRSKRTEIILEDSYELNHKQDNQRNQQNNFLTSYYHQIPKFSNKYMNPVLSSMRKDCLTENSDIQIDKKYLKNPTSSFKIDSQSMTQEVSKEYQIQKNQKSQQKRNMFNNTSNNLSKNSYSQSFQSINEINAFGTSPTNKKISNKFVNNQQNIPKSETKQPYFQNDISEGKKKIIMKRQEKLGSKSQVFDSTYLRSSNLSQTNLNFSKQSIEQKNQKQSLNVNTKNDNSKSQAFFAQQSKSNENQSIQNAQNKQINFGAKESLPDINSSYYTQQYSQRNQSQEKLPIIEQLTDRINLKQNSQSQISTASLSSQKNQSREDDFSQEKNSKKKRVVKSKSNISSKNIFQFNEIYQISKKQSN